MIGHPIEGGKTTPDRRSGVAEAAPWPLGVV